MITAAFPIHIATNAGCFAKFVEAQLKMETALMLPDLKWLKDILILFFVLLKAGMTSRRLVSHTCFSDAEDPIFVSSAHLAQSVVLLCA